MLVGLLTATSIIYTSAVSGLEYPSERVASGTHFSCAIHPAENTSALRCWGQDKDQQSAPPFGDYRQVAAGLRHACAIKLDFAYSFWPSNPTSITERTIVCWGNNDWGQADVPYSRTKGNEYLQVATGYDHTCALHRRKDKGDPWLICWGRNTGGLVSNVPSGGFKQVTAGLYHSCAIDTEDHVQCWGNNYYRQIEGTGILPQEGGNTAALDSFMQISAGNYFTCGVREDQTIYCWGGYESEHKETYAPWGTFGHVSAGADFACGIRTNHTLECWGRNDRGQANPPEGPFSEVSTGYDHACGIRLVRVSDSQANTTFDDLAEFGEGIVCWGSDEFGQSSSTDCNGAGRRCFWGGCDTSKSEQGENYLKDKCPISWPHHFVHTPKPYHYHGNVTDAPREIENLWVEPTPEGNLSNVVSQNWYVDGNEVTGPSAEYWRYKSHAPAVRIGMRALTKSP